MITKSSVAATALAVTLASFSIPQAFAHSNAGVAIGFGVGYGDSYDNDFYDDVGYGGISCWKGKQIVRWQGFKHVEAYDCSAPVYKYRAWKQGEPYRVRVNTRGHIIGVKPL